MDKLHLQAQQHHTWAPFGIVGFSDTVTRRAEEAFLCVVTVDKIQINLFQIPSSSKVFISGKVSHALTSETFFTVKIV